MTDRDILTRFAVFLALLCAGLLWGDPVLAHAQIIIVNRDQSGEGFNDPTPLAPIGGNAGTTLGEQRLIAVRAAADIWGAALDSSVPISVDATSDPRTCTGAAAFGLAIASSILRDFPGAPLSRTWYAVALVNKLVGEDQLPETSDLTAAFNSAIGTGPGCSPGSSWYYGLDGHGAAGQIDLVAVVLRELGHGLGLRSLASVAGELRGGLIDVYSARCALRCDRFLCLRVR
jgi:hypothetical protein